MRVPTGSFTPLLDCLYVLSWANLKGVYNPEMLQYFLEENLSNLEPLFATLQPKDMTAQRSGSLTQQHLNHKLETSGQIPHKKPAELFAPPSREIVSTASYNCQRFPQWCAYRAGRWQCVNWQVVERLAGCKTALSSIPDQWSCWLTHISLSPPSVASTQPLTNNLTRCGMWLNTKARVEQVLMNHKQPQGSGAPAPHITDCDYYYYYHHHSFLCSIISQIVWLLPKQQLVIWGVISMC